MTFKVYIPARYASTRLSGKPLLTVAGKILLQNEANEIYYRRFELHPLRDGDSLSPRK